VYSPLPILDMTRHSFTDIEFTSVQIAEEILENEDTNRTPSPASGLDPDDFCPAGSRILWLLEPFRGSRSVLVEKFSSTLEFPDNKGQLGCTISAFTHFAYEHTHRDVVYADIQGMIGYFVHPKHTLTGDTRQEFSFLFVINALTPCYLM
jgi:hypothetical protein